MSSPPSPSLPGTLDLSVLPERQRLAFYGALFALAAADDVIDERESDQILESLDLSGLSEEAREQALALSISPPSLQSCLSVLREAPEAVRLGLMLNLVDVALADGEIEPGEPLGLEVARRALALSPDHLEAMHTFVYQVRRRAQREGVTLRRPLASPPHWAADDLRDALGFNDASTREEP